MSELPAEPVRTRPRRRMLPAVLVLAVLAAAVLAVLLVEPTLFGRTVLDRGAVERDVAAQFQQREGVAVTLVCPHEMAVVRGASYRCTGTTAEGETVPVRIVVTATSPAAYAWTLR
jgi:hypothetical protein